MDLLFSSARVLRGCQEVRTSQRTGVCNTCRVPTVMDKAYRVQIMSRKLEIARFQLKNHSSVLQFILGNAIAEDLDWSPLY